MDVGEPCSLWSELDRNPSQDKPALEDLELQRGVTKVTGAPILIHLKHHSLSEVKHILKTNFLKVTKLI